MEVGDVIESANFGPFKVVSMEGTDKKSKAVVKFLKTGSQVNTQIGNAVVGGIADYAGGIELFVGQVWNTNNWGKVEVVDGKNTKRVVVKFLDSGNCVTTQKFSLLSGLVKDTELQKKTTEDKEAAQKFLSAAKSIAEEEDRELIKKLKSDSAAYGERVKKTEQEYRKLRLSDLRHAFIFEADRIEFEGKRYVDKLGWSYVATAPTSKSGKTWKVTYEESGNIYEVPLKLMMRGSAEDKLRRDFKENYELWSKAGHAQRYLDTREEKLAYQAQWQKDNKDKVKARNDRYRSQAASAEGSHTSDELDEMLHSQGYACAVCKCDFSNHTKHLDHVMPVSLGGSHYIENMQWLCQYCNISKSGRHPDDWDKYRNSSYFMNLIEARRLKT